MTMNEMKKAIVKSFKVNFGFAPALKDIKPLETSGCGSHYDFIAFHVNGIGYIYRPYELVIRNNAYDMNKEY